MATLPTDIDGSYSDRSPGDKAHQQHHDTLHALNNVFDDAPDDSLFVKQGGVLVPVGSGTYVQAAPPIPGGVSNDWLVPLHTSKGSSVAINDDSARYVPIWIPKQVTVDAIGLELVTAQTGASACQIGLYTSDANGRPGTLVSGSDGTIDGSGATGLLAVAVSLTLDPGLYYGCFLSKITGTSPTWRTFGGGWHVPFNISNIVSGTVTYQAYTGVITGATLPASAHVNSVTASTSSPLIGLQVA